MAVCGFSAGGHLCASLCVHWEDIHDAREEYERISNRPDAAVLCYPVITSGEKAHRDSFRALLGENASKEDLEYMSVEKYVTDQTSPAFIWATVTDDLVPVENGTPLPEEFREAMENGKADAQKRMPNEEVAVWPELAAQFLRRIFK